LGNTESPGIVDSLVGETLNEYLEQNPQVADTIIEKAVQAYKAAEAARLAGTSTTEIGPGILTFTR
jgi:DNA gyrase subunit B